MNKTKSWREVVLHVPTGTTFVGEYQHIPEEKIEHIIEERKEVMCKIQTGKMPFIIFRTSNTEMNFIPFSILKDCVFRYEAKEFNEDMEED